MYSQANVREESVLRPPTRALPSVIVDTEKVLREADGPMKRAVPRPAMRDGWKGVRPWVRLESRSGEPVRSPKNTSATSTSGSQEPMIASRILPTYLQLFFEMVTFRNSIRNGTEFCYQ